MEHDFKRWFLSYGGYFHVGAYIDSGLNGFYLRVQSKQEGLPPGTNIVSCPHALTISWLNVVKDSFLVQYVPKSFNHHILSQSVFTRFFFMKQVLLQEKSLWWPYIRILPPPGAGRNLNTPIWYGTEDLAWIRGTNLEFGAENLEGSWRQEYEAAIDLFNLRGSEDTKIWSWSLYKWVATIFTSRSFPGSALAHSTLAKENSLKGQTKAAEGENHIVGQDCPILIPGMDLLNHRPSAKVTWVWGHSECSIMNNDPITQNSQIWNNYGPKSNEELILGYGFSLFRNLADFCRIALSPEIKQRIANIKKLHQLKREVDFGRGLSNDPMVEAENKSLHNFFSQDLPNIQYGEAKSLNNAQWAEPADQDIQWIRLKGHSLQDHSDIRCEFSLGFLGDMSIAFANKREIAESDFQLQSNIDFSSAQSSRNKFHVACAVTMILQRQQMAITKHDSDLPPWPQNENQFHAARYRRNQVQTLNSGISSLLSYLQELRGLKKSAARDVRIIRLEDILTDGSQGFLADFRATLNAGLGTRNAARIRKNLWVECVFTLWLCGLWLHTESEGVSVCSGSSSTILRWVSFLRRAYKFPAEAGSQGAHTTPNSDIVVGVEIHLLCESFILVIQAAVTKNPRSLYRNPDVNIDRLKWCLNIIREEGVMCPDLNGNLDEEEDEFLLFLDDIGQ